MQFSRLVLRYPRSQRLEAVRQYVGNHWSEEGSQKRVPLNLLSLYVGIVSKNLIAKNPRVLLTTFDPSARGMASAMQAWANREIIRSDLAGTLGRVVVDALFCLGIAKVCLATPADAAVSGFGLGAGQPGVFPIDFDDFVFDSHCRDLREAGFMGHRFRAPLAAVKDSPLYSPWRKSLPASIDARINKEGDERVSTLGRTYLGGDYAEYEPFVDLWEVYLPRHKLVLTLGDDQLSGPSGGSGEPLRVQKWLGPETGPYHLLGFGTVPGNALPKAPVQDLIDLHLANNILYRKLLDQAQGQKEVLPVRGGSNEDAERFAKTPDGHAFRCDNADNLKPVSVSGPNASVANFAMHLTERFGYLAGNLDMMGGLKPQSKTMGQDQMLEQNASRSLADMQDRTVTFTAGILRALAWYWHHDPFKVMKSKWSPPGMPEISAVRKVTPEQRQAHSFEEMDLEIEPYSMQHSTPQQRMQSILQVVSQVYQPNAQMAMQQGLTLDLQALFEKLGRYMDLPELGEILTVREPPQEGGGTGAPAQTSPTETTRNYVRRSLGGENTDAQNQMEFTNDLGKEAGASLNGQPS